MVRTLKVLSALLTYPDEAIQEAAPALREAGPYREHQPASRRR